MKKLFLLLTAVVFTLTSCEVSDNDETCNCYKVTYSIYNNTSTETSELYEVGRTFIGCSTPSTNFYEEDGVDYLIKIICE